MRTTMGEKIKDLRVERRMTTKQLAQVTGISEPVLNGLENDSGRDVGYSRIIDLAKFFDVPTDFLLGFTESRITKNIELSEQEMIEVMDGLPDNGEDMAQDELNNIMERYGITKENIYDTIHHFENSKE